MVQAWQIQGFPQCRPELRRLTYRPRSNLECEPIMGNLEAHGFQLSSLATRFVHRIRMVYVSEPDLGLETLQQLHGLFNRWMPDLLKMRYLPPRVKRAVDKGDIRGRNLVNDPARPPINVRNIDHSLRPALSSPHPSLPALRRSPYGISHGIGHLVTMRHKCRHQPQIAESHFLVRMHQSDFYVLAMNKLAKRMRGLEKLSHCRGNVYGQGTLIQRLLPKVPEPGTVTEVRVGKKNAAERCLSACLALGLPPRPAMLYHPLPIPPRRATMGLAMYTVSRIPPRCPGILTRIESTRTHQFSADHIEL